MIQLRHRQPSLWHSGLAKDIEDYGSARTQLANVRADRAIRPHCRHNVGASEQPQRARGVRKPERKPAAGNEGDAVARNPGAGAPAAAPPVIKRNCVGPAWRGPFVRLLRIATGATSERQRDSVPPV